MEIWAKSKDFSEGKFLVVRRDGSVPHWPHFVLGARDPASPVAIRAYADACEQQGSDARYVASLRDLADDFEAYRAREGDGDREAPPHRTDDPDVIDAMRGRETVIAVKPDKRNVPKAPAHD